MNYVVLYNPYAGNCTGKENAELLSVILYDDKLEYVDITTVDDYKKLFNETPSNYGIVISGGDGTLNRFINKINGIRIKQKLFYFPCGSGNDFARDMGNGENLIPLDEYIQHLPVVCVNGKEYKFINAVGFGIDGYCCEVGDEIRNHFNRDIVYRFQKRYYRYNDDCAGGSFDCIGYFRFGA